MLDFTPWLDLAAEVEHLFGPMVEEPGFHRALLKNIERHSAFCVREDNGPPGSPLMGGLLLSPHPPTYQIGWLAVAVENLPTETKAAILQKMEGNPFFVEEVIRWLIDRGVIYQEGERWQAKASITELEVPDTIQSVILSRIDRLHEEVMSLPLPM